MANHPIQLSVEYKGKAYGGIYSVSGNLIIARIPGISSRSHDIDEAEPEPLARTLLETILADADADGSLDH